MEVIRLFARTRDDPVAKSVQRSTISTACISSSILTASVFIYSMATYDRLGRLKPPNIADILGRPIEPLVQILGVGHSIYTWLVAVISFWGVYAIGIWCLLRIAGLIKSFMSTAGSQSNG